MHVLSKNGLWNDGYRIYIIYHVLKWGKHKNWKEYENIWRTKNGYIFVAAKPAWAG